MKTPRVDIDLTKIAKNVRFLKKHYSQKGIKIMGVTKAICGHPEIAEILVEEGIKILADSRISNIKRMKKAGVKAKFILIRTPLLSELEEVISYADISHNTELIIITKLSRLAKSKGKIHEIILMVELGDLRDGILPPQLPGIIKKVKLLKGVKIVGLATNLACFGGTIPNQMNMGCFSILANQIEKDFNLKLTYISGGNSANYNWFNSTNDIGKTNYLRIGESIFLGVEPVFGQHIPGLFTTAFQLVTEVIESNKKPSVPIGEMGQDAFGQIPEFQQQGQINRVITACGKQDLIISGITPLNSIEIIGATSDHLILNSHQKTIKVGTSLRFDMNYGALMSAMASNFVIKKIKKMTTSQYCDQVETNDLKLKSDRPYTPIFDNNSPLVSLLDCGFNLIYEPSIDPNYQYLVRKELVEKIGRISKELDKNDQMLIIRSTWRSFNHQRLIWENQHAFISKKHPDKSVKEIDDLVSTFIAPPKGSMHSTGGAIDGLIYDMIADKVLDFGTNNGFDIDLNQKCFPYHPEISDTAKKNRALLINLFENEGFLCDTKEYWHFDYGNVTWATKKDNQYAFYDILYSS